MFKKLFLISNDLKDNIFEAPNTTLNLKFYRDYNRGTVNVNIKGKNTISIELKNIFMGSNLYKNEPFNVSFPFFKPTGSSSLIRMPKIKENSSEFSLIELEYNCSNSKKIGKDREYDVNITIKVLNSGIETFKDLYNIEKERTIYISSKKFIYDALFSSKNMPDMTNIGHCELGYFDVDCEKYKLQTLNLNNLDLLSRPNVYYNTWDSNFSALFPDTNRNDRHLLLLKSYLTKSNYKGGRTNILVKAYRILIMNSTKLIAKSGLYTSSYYQNLFIAEYSNYYVEHPDQFKDMVMDIMNNMRNNQKCFKYLFSYIIAFIDSVKYNIGIPDGEKRVLYILEKEKIIKEIMDRYNKLPNYNLVMLKSFLMKLHSLNMKYDLTKFLDEEKMIDSFGVEDPTYRLLYDKPSSSVSNFLYIFKKEAKPSKSLDMFSLMYFLSGLDEDTIKNNELELKALMYFFVNKFLTSKSRTINIIRRLSYYGIDPEVIRPFIKIGIKEFILKSKMKNIDLLVNFCKMKVNHHDNVLLSTTLADLLKEEIIEASKMDVSNIKDKKVVEKINYFVSRILDEIIL